MNIGYTILVHVVWFLSTYFVIVFILALFSNRNKLYESPSLKKDNKPKKVSIVISAYNEENTISDCIKSLQRIDYPKELYEILVVNDGSKDKTSEVIRRYADNKNIMFIDNEKNKGKAACLNEGIERAKGEYIACMDADSIVSEDILKKTVPYFEDEKVGSVTVSVEVRFVKNFLQRILGLIG